MRDAWLLFPHTLFERVTGDAEGMEIRLVEPALFFDQFPFHRQKLFLHRVSMARFAAQIGARHHRIEEGADLDDALMGIDDAVHVYELVDDWLERDLRAACARRRLRLIVHESPGFLTPRADLDRYAEARRPSSPLPSSPEGRGEPRFFQHDFYVWQRKRMGLLLDAMGGPKGGRWSHDEANRHALPASVKAPMTLAFPPPEPYADEARDWIDRRYPENPGELHPDRYPTTHAEAREALAWFVDFALPLFGPYQDAMRRDESFLFHSALSPALNAGLLTPREVLDAVLAAADIPLATVEGFVRQLVGWREFMRLTYLKVGRHQRTRNALRHVRPLPPGFWSGTTGPVAVDGVVKRVLRTGYAHHIERLMVLSNAMLLLEVDPDEVYRWFMSLFVDAYDWVMVPNVYGVGQFADGGMVSTKPYIAASSYLTKMGDWAADPVLDALYWRFVHRHRDLLLGNARLAEVVRAWDEMPRARKEALGFTLRRWRGALFQEASPISPRLPAGWMTPS